MKIYLDNCCFNRPYDDQSQITVFLEAQAKLYIQQLILLGDIDFVSSFILDWENGNNKYLDRRTYIASFQKNAVEYIDISKANDIIALAEPIAASGVKAADACHVACAEYASCDYFITTDKRLLKYKSQKTNIVDPIDFIQILSTI